MAVVTTYGLSKTYKSGIFGKKTSVPAVTDVSIQVEEGDIFGLLGPNGAGKTTFVKLLLSIVNPSKGSAQLLGKPLGDVEVRSHCGYLPENHRYPSFLTALETLTFFGELNGMPRKGTKDKVVPLLEFVGLKEWSDRKILKFSKGMLQRLGLAQALLNDPQILFLDEPTDGVDPLGRKEMRDLFLALKHKGVSIFLNSHLLSEVEMISDKIAILNKGALIKVGTLDEIRGGQTIHHITVSGSLSQAQIQSLSLDPSSIRFEQATTIISATTEIDLNKTIDVLRSLGIPIRSISQEKSSLEDSFIKLISKGIAE